MSLMAVQSSATSQFAFGRITKLSFIIAETKMESTFTPLNTQPQISEAMLWVASAFGMQDFETFSLVATRENGMEFSILIPDKESMEMRFQLYIKDEKLFEYWIHIYDEGSRITSVHARIYNFDGASDTFFEDFFQTPYGRHISGGFYLLGIDRDFIDFLGVFTAHEKLEMALQHRELMQKLTQLSRAFQPSP